MLHIVRRLPPRAVGVLLVLSAIALAAGTLILAQ